MLFSDICVLGSRAAARRVSLKGSAAPAWQYHCRRPPICFCKVAMRRLRCMRPRTVRPLIADVVCLAAASESIQAPFIPTGPGDHVKIARWTLLASDLGPAYHRAAFDKASSTGSLNPWPRPELGLHQRARRSRRDGRPH